MISFLFVEGTIGIATVICGMSWICLLPDGQSSFIVGPMEYRSDDKGLWHFCEKCPLWPDESFNIIILPKLPQPEFELCKTCVALAANDT